MKGEIPVSLEVGESSATIRFVASKGNLKSAELVERLGQFLSEKTAETQIFYERNYLGKMVPREVKIILTTN